MQVDQTRSTPSLQPLPDITLYTLLLQLPASSNFPLIIGAINPLNTNKVDIVWCTPLKGVLHFQNLVIIFLVLILATNKLIIISYILPDSVIFIFFPGDFEIIVQKCKNWFFLWTPF